jgi:glycosyltransferase involved in cell wall biosynthesis
VTALRFCFLTTFYPPHNFGGDGIAVQRLARALVRAGHRVTVVHDADAYATMSGGHTPAAGDGEPEGLEVIPLRSAAGAVSVLLTQQLGRPVVHGRRIARILATGAFDVINFHNVSLIGGPGLLKYGRALKLYTAHEHWLVCPTHVLWRYRREVCPRQECVRCQLVYRRPPQLWRETGYLQRELAHVDAFIAMSEFSRRKHREFGFPRDMEVLPPLVADGPPVAVRDATRPYERPYFLFAGRLEEIKGVQDVIPLFAEYRDADLVIAGDGTYADALRAQAAGNERVRFLGRVAPDALAGWFRHAIAAVVPSVCYETFGISVIDAFREGTPVIARRLGPLPEIVETSGGGELFSDAGELAASLRRLQHDPALRERLGTAGHEAFRTRWSERVVVNGYLDIVRRAAERRGGRPRDARIAAGSLN